MQAYLLTIFSGKFGKNLGKFRSAQWGAAGMQQYPLGIFLGKFRCLKCILLVIKFPKIFLALHETLKMYYFSNKFSKFFQRWAHHPSAGDLKLRDLVKLCFFKRIMTKSNFKKSVMMSFQ